MVVASSDSDNTLLSLEEKHKNKLQEDDVKLEPDGFFETNLRLPCEGEECSPVFLPKTGAVEVSLGRLPSLQKSRQALINKPLIKYSAGELSSPLPKILYLAQREVGHALPCQADVIMSDRATTCHILVLRSTFTQEGSGQPLTSCAHLDAPWYDTCLAGMFEQHYQHHNSNTSSSGKIHMDIHIVGGFLDKKGRSQALTNWLLYQLSDLASEYRRVFQCTLQTCIVSTLNHTTITSNHPDSMGQPTPAPLGRGLACHLATGDIFFAWCDETVMGPDPLLRQARLWSSNQPDHLVTVHRSSDNNTDTLFVIPPFQMSSYSNVPRMLAMSKGELLYNSSTSPACEEDDYIEWVFKALSLLQRYSTKKVFGSSVGPRRYVRDDSGGRNNKSSNQWSLLPFKTSASQGTKHPNRQPRSRQESKKLLGQPHSAASK